MRMNGVNIVLKKQNIGNEIQKEDYTSGLTAARGIGIILVVFGHTLTDDIVDTSLLLTYLRYTVYLLHMPLFFVISGYLFELKKKKYVRSGFKKFAVSKGKLLMIPYISFSIVVWGISLIASEIQPISTLFQKAGYPAKGVVEFLFSLVTYIKPVDNHLWFSYVLYLVFLLSFLVNTVKKRYLLPIAWIGYALSFLLPLPELIWKIMHYFFLFQMGTVLFNKKICLNNRKLLVLISIFFAICYGFFCLFRFWQWTAPQIFVQPIAEISGSILIIYLSIYIRNTQVGGYLQKFGTKSYQIYLLHHPFIVPVFYLLLNGRVPVFMLCTVATACGLLIPVGIYKILSKRKLIKFCFFGGRK